MHVSFLAFENMSEEDCVPQFTPKYLWKEIINRSFTSRLNLQPPYTDVKIPVHWKYDNITIK